jgi:hypothetical protein
MEVLGNAKPFDVGTLVHVPLNDVNRTKVDSGNLVGIIVKVDKTRSQAHVAVKGGLLKSWYVYHKLNIVPGEQEITHHCLDYHWWDGRT